MSLVDLSDHHHQRLHRNLTALEETVTSILIDLVGSRIFPDFVVVVDDELCLPSCFGLRMRLSLLLCYCLVLQCNPFLIGMIYDYYVRDKEIIINHHAMNQLYNHFLFTRVMLPLILQHLHPHLGHTLHSTLYTLHSTRLVLYPPLQLLTHFSVFIHRCSAHLF